MRPIKNCSTWNTLFLVFSGKSKEELDVDFGVFSPQVTDAVVSGKQLCAQLADGKNIPLPELLDLFCLYDNVPLEVRITEDLKEAKTHIRAVLSEWRQGGGANST